MRGPGLPGGGVPAGDIVLGSVPERVRRQQEPGAAAGHGVPAACVQAARARLPRAARRVARLLHRQQYHAHRSLCKYLSLLTFNRRVSPAIAQTLDTTARQFLSMYLLLTNNYINSIMDYLSVLRTAI